MTTHPESYKQLNNKKEWIKTIADQEREISARKMYYIQETEIPEIENQLKDGDIIGITTTVKGLDISHTGILIRKSGHIHLLHASSTAKKVIVSEEPLEQYLLKNKSTTGIMIARPI